MAYSGNTGLTRIIKAAQYSWQGFRAAYKHEEAFRQEVWLIILAIPLALWFGENSVDRRVRKHREESPGPAEQDAG